MLGPLPVSRSRLFSRRAEKVSHIECRLRTRTDADLFQYLPLAAKRKVNLGMAKPANGLCRPESLHSTMRLNPVRQVSISRRTICLIMVIVLVKGLADRQIVDVACGQQHAIALDKDGRVTNPCWSRSILTLPQACLRLGLQRILPSGSRQPARRAGSKNGPTGMSVAFNDLLLETASTVAVGVVRRSQRNHNGCLGICGAIK